MPRPRAVEEVPLTASPALTVAAVARRLGVAPATLRTWDRRYGLGPSERTAGAHRRYGPVDLARLTVMRRLTLEGVPPVEAAAVALGTEFTQRGHLAAVDTLVDRPAPHAGGRAGDGAADGTEPARSPGLRALERATVALDGDAVATVVRTSLVERGVLRTWDELLLPMLTRVGDQWASSGDGIEVEHLLADAVSGVLREASGRVERPRNTRAVLLACVAADQHSLPLLAVSAALAEQDVTSRVLGARVPPSALAAAVRRTGPGAVFLWSQLVPGAPADGVPTGDPVPPAAAVPPSTASAGSWSPEGEWRAPADSVADSLASMSAVRPAPRLVLGGPGWEQVEVPPSVTLVHRLGEAVQELASTVVS